MSLATKLAFIPNITVGYIPRATATGFVNGMVYDNGTNVGIGTINPEANSQLTLYGSSFSQLHMQNGTTGTGPNGFRILMDGNNLTMTNREAGYWAFETSDTERMRITSGGYVGIGTTNPASNLNVSGTGDIFRISGGGSGTLYQSYQNSGGNYFIGISSSTGGGLLGGQSAYSFCLVTESARDMAFGTNNTERMRITSAGPINLGSTTNYVSVGNDGGGVYFETSGNTDATRFARFQVGNFNSSQYSSMSIDGANQFVRFSTANNERMRITSSGNVLIGRTGSSALGSNTKFAVTGSNGAASLGSVYFGGTSPFSTGIPIDQFESGGTIFVIASRHTSDGTSTQSAAYLVRFFYNGNNAPTTHYIGGSSDWLSFGTSGGFLTVTNGSGGACSVSWFGNK